MSYLQNHLLIAMPTMEDNFFARSVIYVCEHNAKGAMGLTLTVPLDMDLHHLLTQMKIEDVDLELSHHPVLAGGPVNTDRGFVLHSPRLGLHSSLQLTDDLMITTSLDILKELGTGNAPDQFLVALGYAGWEAGQLEQELLDNSWLTLPATTQLLFHTPWQDKWLAATHAMGIDIWRVAPQAGHA